MRGFLGWPDGSGVRPKRYSFPLFLSLKLPVLLLLLEEDFPSVSPADLQRGSIRFDVLPLFSMANGESLVWLRQNIHEGRRATELRAGKLQGAFSDL